MRARRFQQVDVFTAVAYRGNPLAVILDGEGLSTEQMQHFTNWTNLSEATFVLPPSDEGRRNAADYRVRIFCPGRELPFAGHPTIGTCHAWLRAGGRPAGSEIVQECGAGVVRIRRDGSRLAFAAPSLRRSGPLDEADVQRIARGLGLRREEIIRHAWCDNGPNWRCVMLESAERVLEVRPDSAILDGLDVGLVGASRENSGGGFAFEVRAFFPGGSGLTEDPVTGSLNAAIGEWLIGAGVAPKHYAARQGTALGRDGRVFVRSENGQIWIGGDAVTCVDGSVFL